MGGVKMENQKLRDILSNSENIVFFGGAGVSTESGIPDFRSVDGLYHKKYKYPPEEILSHNFFMENTEEFYEFYRAKMIFSDRKPNAAHQALSHLEKSGRLKAVITQNIDGLHQAAGSKSVLELHGSIHRNYCMKCRQLYGLERIFQSSGVPLCDCGGVIKPDVVLYEENLDDYVMKTALSYIKKAETLMIGGTSLTVYPAAGMVRYFSGANLILINKSPTPMDEAADMVIQGSIGEVLGAAVS